MLGKVVKTYTANFDIILRFRSFATTWTAFTEKAFHQLAIAILCIAILSPLYVTLCAIWSHLYYLKNAK